MNDMTTSKLGTSPEPATVRLERLLPGPIERVWAYLTEADKRATWFAGGVFDLRVGGKANLYFDHSTSRRRKPPRRRYEEAIPQNTRSQGDEPVPEIGGALPPRRALSRPS